jgi:hypothetical protein
MSNPTLDDDDEPTAHIDAARFHQPTKDLPGLAGFAALGTSIALCITVGVLAGLWADSAWSISPWGLLIGLLLGAAAGTMSVLKLVRRWL